MYGTSIQENNQVDHFLSSIECSLFIVTLAQLLGLCDPGLINHFGISQRRRSCSKYYYLAADKNKSQQRMLYPPILTTPCKAHRYNSFVVVIKIVSIFEIGRDGVGSRILKLTHEESALNQESGIPSLPTPLQRKSTDGFATTACRIGR